MNSEQTIFLEGNFASQQKGNREDGCPGDFVLQQDIDKDTNEASKSSQWESSRNGRNSPEICVGTECRDNFKDRCHRRKFLSLELPPMSFALRTKKDSEEKKWIGLLVTQKNPQSHANVPQKNELKIKTICQKTIGRQMTNVWVFRDFSLPSPRHWRSRSMNVPVSLVLN